MTVYDVASEKIYYYHTDANKNVTELSDESGNVVAHYEYSPFGSLTKVTGDYAGNNPFRFSSEYFDEETGIVYYNYRYYNPELGRWISRDPIEEQGGYNLYGMIGNNPLHGWDHRGHNNAVEYGKQTVSWGSIFAGFYCICRGKLITGGILGSIGTFLSIITFRSDVDAGVKAGEKTIMGDHQNKRDINKDLPSNLKAKDVYKYIDTK